jgi:hypothetical protein
MLFLNIVRLISLSTFVEGELFEGGHAGDAVGEADSGGHRADVDGSNRIWRSKHDSVDVRRGVAKGPEEGCRPPPPAGGLPLKWLLGRFRGGPPAGRRRVEYGGP